MALALIVVVAGLAVPPAGAHTGDQLAQPIFERIKPAAPGVTIEVAYTANYQLLVGNPTDKELVVYADAGEPYIRIGPDGVFGNFKSKSWYNSNVPEGLLQFPEGAEDGPGVEPVWRKVSAEPFWGWFDHRLHPVERYLSKEVRESRETVVLSRWKVPISYGGEKGNIEGRIQFKPVLGNYKSFLKSPENLAEGVKVQLASAPKVPALFIENLSDKTVTILGREGEPFGRVGPAVEVNLHSPTYVEIQKARGITPEVEADADAEPQWERIHNTPRWTWLEFRAAAPEEEPPKEIVDRAEPTTVRNWRVPLLIGDERAEIVGFTQFIPVDQLVREAGGRTGGGGSSRTGVLAAIALVTIGVGYAVLRPKKKATPAPAPAAARHRSRATPKVKR